MHEKKRYHPCMYSAIEAKPLGELPAQPASSDITPEAPPRSGHGRARKLIAALTTSAIVGAPLALAADTYLTEQLGSHPAPRIEEVGISLPCIDAETITLYESGMGETNALKVATIGSVALADHDSCATYVDDGDTVQPVAIANKFIDFLTANTRPGDKKHLIFNGLSTGGLVLLQAVIELQKHDNLPIEDITVILDSTPDASSNVKIGSNFNLPQIFIDNCENLPGGAMTNTITKSFLYARAALQGQDITELSTRDDIDYTAKGMELRRIASQACAIKDASATLSQLSTMKLQYPIHTVYLQATQDAVIDSKQASLGFEGLGKHTLLMVPIGHEVQVGLGAALPDFIRTFMGQLFPLPKSNASAHCVLIGGRHACPV